MNNAVRIYYTDGEIGTFTDAFIFAYSDHVLVVKEHQTALKHVIPHQAYTLASEITVEK